MKQIGTALEWFKTKPEAYIAHLKLQPGVCLKVCEYAPTGRSTQYQASSSDGDPWIWFGPKCPYLVTGQVKYFVHAVYGLVGGMTALSDRLGDDPTWYEVEPDSHYENSSPA